LFTLQNLASALLGGLFGALIAVAIEFPGTLAKASRLPPTNIDVISGHE